MGEFAGIPYQQKPLSADKKKSQAMDDALNWIRKNDPKVKDNPDEATITALSKLTGLPMPKKRTPRRKKEFVNESIKWLRKNDPGKLHTVDDPTAKAFTKLAGISLETRPLTAKKKKSEVLKDAL